MIDFVARRKGQSVWILGKGGNHVHALLFELGRITIGRLVSCHGTGGTIVCQWHNDVNSIAFQGAHEFIVILGGIDAVETNGVDAQGLQVDHVAFPSVGVVVGKEV